MFLIFQTSTSSAPRVDPDGLAIPIIATSRTSHSYTGQPSRPSVDFENSQRPFGSYPTNGCRVVEDVSIRNPKGHSSLEQLAAVASSFAEGSGFVVFSGPNSELDRVPSPLSNNLSVLVSPAPQLSQTPTDSDSDYKQANICGMRPIHGAHTPSNWNQSTVIFQPTKPEKNSHELTSEREPSIQQVSLFSTHSRDSHSPVACRLSPSVETIAASLELPFPIPNGVISSCASNSTTHQSTTGSQGGRTHIGLLEHGAVENLFVPRYSSSRPNSTSFILNSGLTSQLTKQPCVRHVLRDCDRPTCPIVTSTSLSYAVLPSYQPNVWESSTNPARYPQFSERGVTPGKPSNTPNLPVHWKKEKIRESVEEDFEFDNRDVEHDLGFDNDLTATIGQGHSCCPCCACEQTDSSASLFQVRKRRLSSELPENVSEGKLVCCCPTTTPADKRTLETNLYSPSAIGQPNGTTLVSPGQDICAQVQDDVLVKVLKTVQQLTAKLNGDADPPEVIQNCRAIQACLDTIAAIKRSKATEPYGPNPMGLEQQISPTNATVTKRDSRAQYNGSAESH
ncbi:hypothetical protein P879_05475 [Paragonimus westermani]|uniref:Uncharacterized protein n=1 Tax=Paragonimus westermani TaxID=34504 RepID=A0A8T0DFL4_9TREM|nr:hypothetical protein P879_05475 [Paragonimus westermani]